MLKDEKPHSVMALLSRCFSFQFSAMCTRFFGRAEKRREKRIRKIRIIWAILRFSLWEKRNLIRMKIDLSAVINLNGFQKLLFLFIFVSFHSHLSPLLCPWHFLHPSSMFSIRRANSHRRAPKHREMKLENSLENISLLFKFPVARLLSGEQPVRLSHQPLSLWSEFHVVVHFTHRQP